LLAGYHYHFYRYCRELILTGKISGYLSLAKNYSQLKGLDINYIHRQVMNEVKLATKFKLGLAKYGRSAVNKWDNVNTLVELLKLDLTENIMPTLLRADDRNSMAFSVETRQPFLDYRLVDFCFSIPSHYKIKDGWQKAILRETVNEMPHEIQYRKDKKGFTTPHKLWIDKYKTSFEEYLKYIPQNYLKNGHNELDTFKKYSLGAWFKLEGKN
jgi:asparagine synthase (glutamine-hydrolysing)